MLRVHGEQQASSPLLGGERELARGDEALLVREREVDAGLERPERGRQACEADDGVEDDVRLGALEQLGEIAADLCQRRQPVHGLRAGGGCDELELRVRGDDLECLAADRARGSEERDSLHAASVRGCSLLLR